MWQATVLEVVAPGWVVVAIPGLYGSSPIGPMKASVELDVGEQVIVADLTQKAKTHQWWVLGRESEVGRAGVPYAHTHPLGQVDGLVAALAGKVSTSTYTTGMAGKATAPGSWLTVPLDSRLVADSRSTSVPHSDVVFAIRRTPLGTQIRGLYNVSATIPGWTLLGTIPEASGLRPTVVMRTLVAAVMDGTAPTNLTGKAMQMNIDRDGSIRNRDEWLTGWVTFDWLAPDYYA